MIHKKTQEKDVWCIIRVKKKNYHWDAAYYYKNFVTPLFLKKLLYRKLKGNKQNENDS